MNHHLSKDCKLFAEIPKRLHGYIDHCRYCLTLVNGGTDAQKDVLPSYASLTPSNTLSLPIVS